jgi:hypothetical protein
MPLAVQSHWIALLDPNDPMNGPVDVVMLVAPLGGRWADLASDARQRIPEVVERLRHTLPTAGVSEGPQTGAQPDNDDWGSSPTGSESSSFQPAPSTTGSANDEW